MIRIVLAAIVLAGLETTSPVHPVSGVWTFNFEPAMGDRFLQAFDNSECKLKQDKTTLTGTCGSDKVPVMGAVKRNHVTLRIQSDAMATLSATLNRDASRMDGTWQLRGQFGKFWATKRGSEPPRLIGR